MSMYKAKPTPPLANFFELKGKTITSISCPDDGELLVEFTLSDGIKCRLYHSQGCCERVSIAKTVGNPLWLVGKPITLAQDDHPADPEWWDSKGADSYTWTLFVLEADHGEVRVEFWCLGESNGYYGEEVSFECFAP